jgi:hypothetical protein
MLDSALPRDNKTNDTGDVKVLMIRETSRYLCGLFQGVIHYVLIYSSIVPQVYLSVI